MLSRYVKKDLQFDHDLLALYLKSIVYIYSLEATTVQNLITIK